jgi:enoyl-CoA hydratase
MAESEGSVVVADGLVAQSPGPGVRLLRFDRPARRNALTSALVIALGRFLTDAVADDTVRVVVLTGDDQAFSAGADIHEMAERGADAVFDPARADAWQRVATFPKPIVAAVRGVAYGAGCELAMLCDIVVAGQSARFAQPEVKIGGLAGDGGTQRLPRLAGRMLAAQMLLTGEPVSGAKAQAAGLASEVVEDSQVLPRALIIAACIAANAPLAVAATKRLVRMAETGSLSEGLTAERKALADIFKSEDRAEGVEAFLKRRPPVWRGR